MPTVVNTDTQRGEEQHELDHPLADDARASPREALAAIEPASVSSNWERRS